jgi:hypothetical protein
MDVDRVVVRRNVSWGDFERLLARKGERYVPKVKAKRSSPAWSLMTVTCSDP